MASRKQQKEEARQRRLEQERALAAQSQRRRRMQMLGGVLVAAVAVIAVAIAISAGSSNGAAPGLQTNPGKASQTYSQVTTLLKGIPQSGTTLGNPKAKLTMYYYGDLECPDCRAFTLGQGDGGLPQFISKDVRSGKVKLVYRSFCTATCTNHPTSVFNMQQVAAYAAGQQNQFWNYAELFYREQGDETTSYVDTNYLDSLAKQIPTLNFATWQADQKNPSLLGQVQQDEGQATQLGVSGTPTLVASGPKGETEVGTGPYGLPTLSTLEGAIAKVA